MIPRLQARGTSFKGSCTYVLHDQKAKTSDRVEWVLTRNLHSDPDNAWFEMCQTWRNQDALKKNAGVSTRGRKNIAPVLHYTLAWHIDDKPTPEQMQAAALASLKVLGLEEHEAVIVGHNDKQHLHVHIVANTVHPYSGRTAPLKYSKERLSEWAEAYEREHGRIWCEERVKNNEQRRDIRAQRQEERLTETFTASVGAQPPAQSPYIPIKDQSPTRPEWFEKKDIIDRMKRLRAQLDLQHKMERGATWDRQRRERDDLDRNTDAAADNARAHVREKYRPQWRELYKVQGREQRFVTKSATHPLERAVFVFKNRDRLCGGRPLTIGTMVRFIVSTKRLGKALEHAHERERRSLAREEKTLSKELTGRIWAIHRERFHTLRDRQANERKAERGHQRLAGKEITLARAKDDLIRENEGLPRWRPLPPAPKRERPEPVQEFNAASFALPPEPLPLISRAEQIRRDMEAWRRSNPNRDHGREL